MNFAETAAAAAVIDVDAAVADEVVVVAFAVDSLGPYVVVVDLFPPFDSWADSLPLGLFAVAVDC